nr:hypothetical protein [Ganoderma leucocontextum]
MVIIQMENYKVAYKHRIVRGAYPVKQWIQQRNETVWQWLLSIQGKNINKYNLEPNEDMNGDWSTSRSTCTSNFFSRSVIFTPWPTWSVLKRLKTQKFTFFTRDSL